MHKLFKNACGVLKNKLYVLIRSAFKVSKELLVVVFTTSRHFWCGINQKSKFPFTNTQTFAPNKH